MKYTQKKLYTLSRKNQEHIPMDSEKVFIICNEVDGPRVCHTE